MLCAGRGGAEFYDHGGHQLLLCAVVQLHGVVGQGAEFIGFLPGGKIVFGKYIGIAAGVEDGLYHKVVFVHSMPLFFQLMRETLPSLGAVAV